MISVIVRRMASRDIDRVAALEREIFADAWHREAFARELDGRKNMPWVVVDAGGDILGYMIAWFVVDEAHLGNIAVAPGSRKRGIGQSLLDELFAECRERRVRHVFLEVRASNMEAQNLYQKNGFETISVRKRYYADNHEDALVMRKTLKPQSGGHS